MKKTGKILSAAATVVLAAICLLACGVPSKSKAEERLRAAEYTVKATVDGSVLAYKFGSSTDAVYIVYYSSKDTAKKNYDKIVSDIGLYRGTTFASKFSAFGVDVTGLELVAERDGSTVIVGTAAAVKAAK